MSPACAEIWDARRELSLNCPKCKTQENPTEMEVLILILVALIAGLMLGIFLTVVFLGMLNGTMED